MDKVARDFESRWKSLARKIEKKEGVKRDLDALENAGVPRDRMLPWLAVTVNALKDRSAIGAELMRDKRDELRSRAKQMDAFARKVDRALDDPLLRARFWAYLLGYGAQLGMELPHLPVWKDVVGVPLVPSGLRALAKLFRAEAKIFGQFLREFARKDAQTPIAFLLMWVYIFRFRKDRTARPDHLDELARLLTDAIEVAGINKYGRPRVARRAELRKPWERQDECFTADGLGKLWQRQGKRMYRRWLRLMQRRLNPPSKNWQRLNLLASQAAGSSPSSQTPSYASFLGSLTTPASSW